MELKIKLKVNKKILTVILIVILIMLIFPYSIIIKKYIVKNDFANQSIQIYKNNEEKIFKIEKIIVCSSANAIDLSEDKNLQNLSIYQYTDIAIYIDNGEELLNKNTVKKLYIDNIKMEGSNGLGKKSLNYKNISNFGLKQQITESRTTKDINFNIVYTNEQNDLANYNEATFYTDCSNPITLQYLNYDLATNYKMQQNNSVAFDGSILEKVGIPLSSLDCKVKFKINIVNNDNQKFSCWVNFKIPLDDIYSGTTMKVKNTEGNKYIFFRES